MTGSDRPLAVGVDVRALVGTPTGVGFYTLALLERLPEHGVRPLALAHREPEYAEHLRRHGVEIEVQRAPSGVIWQQAMLPRRLRRGDLDVVWSPLAVLPLDLPIPGVTTVHDLTPLLHPEVHRFKVRWSIRPFLGRTLTHAAAVVADSEATAEDLRRYYPACADRLEVIYPGVEAAFRRGAAEAVERVRAELDCPLGYLLYSGTLEPRKNLGLLLDAWEAARAEDPETLPLVLTGPAGWAPRAFFRRLEALEGRGVRWLGRLSRERLVEVIQAARWFVYPSLYEGFGLPVVEAMACGVPPIASAVSSLPEIVGEAGHLIDPRDAGELARLLATVHRDLDAERRLGDAAARRARRFDWDVAARNLARTLREAARTSV